MLPKPLPAKENPLATAFLLCWEAAGGTSRSFDSSAMLDLSDAMAAARADFGSERSCFSWSTSGRTSNGQASSALRAARSAPAKVGGRLFQQSGHYSQHLMRLGSGLCQQCWLHSHHFDEDVGQASSVAFQAARSAPDDSVGTAQRFCRLSSQRIEMNEGRSGTFNIMLCQTE